MTVPECTFLLSTGKKCRAAATRGRPFCRHHDPAAKAAPAGLRIPKHNLFSRHRRWMVINRDFPHTHPADLPGDVFEILHALLADGEDGISDREAGRLLRGMLRRLGAVPFALPEPTLPNMPPRPPAAPSIPLSSGCLPLSAGRAACPTTCPTTTPSPVFRNLAFRSLVFRSPVPRSPACISLGRTRSTSSPTPISSGQTCFPRGRTPGDSP